MSRREQAAGPGWRWERYGPTARLLRFATRIDPSCREMRRLVVQAFERLRPAGVEMIPAGTSALFAFEKREPEQMDRFQSDLEAAVAGPGSTDHAPSFRTLLVPTIYDGADLPAVAASAGLTVDEVIAIHAAGDYQVEAIGFAPGFPYLDGLDARLHLPRRASPRERIPAGSVAIGGGHAGIYPVATPGGWHLLGRTSVRLFLPEAGPQKMFALRVGDSVRFVPQ